MTASYTIWDKVAVSRIPSFLYFYSYTFVTGLFYVILLRRNSSPSKIKLEWRAHKVSIIAVAVLNTFTYLLVLVALGMSKASYVGALRQVSLVVGVFLGWRYLDEGLRFPKLLSIALLILGSVMIAFAK